MIRLSALFIMLFFPMLASTVHAQSSKPIDVFVAVTGFTEISDEVETLGTLQAIENVELTSTVTERVTKVHFQSGQRVKQGDLLVEMDDAQEQAELAEEQSRYREARLQFDRFNSLLKRGVTSDLNLDERRRELQTTEARMRAIQSRIDERRVVAPFDGVVGLRNVSVGALLQPGTLITTVDKDSVMKLDFSVPEVFLSGLSKGLAIQARARAFENEVFIGEIISLDSRINPVTRAILARAEIKNPDQSLRPGLLMRVTLSKNTRTVMVAPEEAILTNGNNSYVFVVKTDDSGSSQVEKRSVTLGLRKTGFVEIKEGLALGDKVVTHGTLKLRDGVDVRVAAIDTGKESLSELLSQRKADIDS